MHTDAPDLETRIRLAERAVIERDRRVQSQGHEVVERVHRAFNRFLGPGLLASAAAVALGWWAPMRRHPPPPAGGAPSTAALAIPWAVLVPLVWPLLPARWRQRVSPATASALVGFAAPWFAAVLPARREVRTAPQVDLARYAGRWYEIARLPAPFEGQCAADATATYTPRGGNVIEVDKRCRGRDGRQRRSLGVGKVVGGSHGAKLEVSLFPRGLRWLPWAWDGYWILQVDADYRWAVVGTPGRKGLWLLARSPALDEASYQQMVGQAAAQGYRVDRLQRIAHGA